MSTHITFQSTPGGGMALVTPLPGIAGARMEDDWDDEYFVVLAVGSDPEESVRSAAAFAKAIGRRVKIDGLECRP